MSLLSLFWFIVYRISGAESSLNVPPPKNSHRQPTRVKTRRPTREQVLRNNDIMFDGIWDSIGKPVCDLYVDDRGYRFGGNWEAELPVILAYLSVRDE